MDLEQKITAAWYGRPGWLQALLPLEGLYRGITALRRSRLQRRQSASPVPVIVVGNITVGGTGKTPLVIALCQWLRQQGYRPGVVSRGYGGNAQQYPLAVDANSKPAEAGDEPCLIAQRSACPVVVSPLRNAGVDLLVSDHRCDVVVSDDGLQHYRMPRDLEIVVVDGQRGLGNGHCLPVGPLREPPARLSEVDFVVVNGGSAEPELAAALPMQLRSGELWSLRGGERQQAADWAQSRRVHAVAGIGNPQRFFEALAELGFEVIAHPFADHHPFVAADLVFDDSLPVIMTEKDAVKCRAFAQPNWWALGVDAELPPAFYSKIGDRLAAIVHQRRAS